MSKIDLSKAKIGDKFRTKNGEVVTCKGTDGRIAKSRSDYYVCVCFDDAKITYFKNGALLLDEEHPYDLVEQVFNDEKDTTDLEIVEAMNQAIKKIPEKVAEREQELQRRQEVVEVANELFTRGTMKDWFYELLRNNKVKTTYVEYIFAYAKEFVIAKDKYLKEGKL